MSRSVLVVLVASLFAACESGEEQGVALTRQELLDPENCKSCHPNHYREWASSMHAYAVDDPVFQAMNRRGQEEAGLGDFCVNCHAPMAVREGAIEDFAELDDLPKHLKGVTCYFCHNAVGVDGDHNGMIRLANDTVMRGSLPDAVTPKAHGVAYSELHERYNPASASLCGGCHDIVTPAGVHLERTFAEYKESLFSQPGGETCQSCHMDSSMGLAAEDPDSPVRVRRIHSHAFPAVDVALTDFPHREAYRQLVECELVQSGGKIFDVYRGDGPLEFEVVLEGDMGHNQPTGAAQDRRMWLEFIAYRADGSIITESGTIDDGEIEEHPRGHPDHDPQLLMLRDRLLGENGEEVHMFWDAVAIDTERSRALPAPRGVGFDHALIRAYTVTEVPARVALRLRIRPMGMDVLQDLVDSEHLDEALLSEMPTFTMHSGEWTPEDGFKQALPPDHCDRELHCFYEPDAPDCQ